MYKVFFFIILFFVLSLNFSFASETLAANSIKGEIINILEEKQIETYGTTQLYQKLEVSLVTKEVVTVENGDYPSAKVNKYLVGDDVILNLKTDANDRSVYVIYDYNRIPALITLVIVFLALVILIGSKKGFLSIISMFVSFLLIITILLPQIMNRVDPLIVAVISSIIIAPITFYFSHGFNIKTSISLLSTFISLFITGLISIIAVNYLHLTGVVSEDVLFLQTVGSFEFDLQSLLLAGIVIGNLGVLDDVTISQTSVVYQMVDIDKKMSNNELFKRSISIGRDHIASLVNTLILVYTGASLPLLLLFTNRDQSFSQIFNLESVTTEVVRMIVGSIGLIIAVPITTYIATYWAKRFIPSKSL